MRAEAASRPVISRAVAGERSTEGLSIFELYLSTILDNLGTSPDAIRVLVERLVPIFRGPGRERLWSYVLPGVPEALEQLQSLGRTLAVVSNSDGTVEQVLERQGLRPYLTAVFDSHIVGFEKPDPRFFRHALEATGARAETTLHVGDLYSADIEGGRAAGVHTALVDPFNDWKDVDCPPLQRPRSSLAHVPRQRRPMNRTAPWGPKRGQAHFFLGDLAGMPWKSWASAHFHPH